MASLDTAAGEGPATRAGPMDVGEPGGGSTSDAALPPVDGWSQREAAGESVVMTKAEGKRKAATAETAEIELDDMSR